MLSTSVPSETYPLIPSDTARVRNNGHSELRFTDSIESFEEAHRATLEQATGRPSRYRTRLPARAGSLELGVRMPTKFKGSNGRTTARRRTLTGFVEDEGCALNNGTHPTRHIAALPRGRGASFLCSVPVYERDGNGRQSLGSRHRAEP